MRILAIRGQNLASLEQRFDIDLDHGPLGRSGLFAITGPTGAGKSTLLDAICLCLYDKTPRLERSGGAAVRLPGDDGDAALNAYDQRNVLRRGATEGWAEVDFTDRTGARWTARWEVRRARRKANGRVQAQTLTLTDAAGQVHGGTRTETKDAIQALVGLGFEQFRRSVMLAQGDFAAFLRAEEQDRAQLLEAMTDSAIYTELSKAAYDRRRGWERRLAELRTRLDEQGVLEPEDRALAEERLAQAARDKVAATARVQAADAVVRWHQDRQRLAQAVVQAETEQQAASQAWDAAASRRDALARAEAGWELRTLARALAQATRQADQAARGAADAERQHVDAQVQLQQAATAQGGARARWALLARARLAQVEARLQAAQDGLRAEQEWLDAHPAHLRLADPAWQAQLADDLQRRAGKAAERRSLQASLTALQAALPERLGAAQAAALDQERADAAAAQAGTALQEARRAATGFDDAALHRQRRELDLQQRALAELLRLADRAAGLASTADEQAQALDEAERAATDAQEQLDRAQDELAQLQPRLAEARRSLEQAQAAVDAAGLRATLQPDQPCPVCGSLDHPWAEGSPLAALHQDLHARVAELDDQQRLATAHLAAQQATLQAHQQAADRARARLAEARAALEPLAQPWTRHAADLGAPDLPGPMGADEALAVHGAALATRKQDLEARETEARLARKAVEEAAAVQQVRLQEARQASDRAGEARRTLEQHQAAESQKQAQLQDLDRDLAERGEALAAHLDPAAAEIPGLAGWREALDAPAPLVQALREAGAEGQRHQRRAQQAEAAVRELKERLPRDRDQADRAAAAAAAEDLAAATAPTPPPGLVPPDLTDWYDQQVQAGAAAADAADAAHQQAQARTAALHTAAEVARAHHAAARTQAEQARDALVQLRDARGLDDAAVDALLALPDGWLEAERAALDALRQAPLQAAARLAERQRLLDEHQAQVPDQDAIAAAQAAAAAREDLAQADEAWGVARGLLQADDDARARMGQLQDELTATRQAAEPWLQLADCIGQADGHKLRRFAQSLTLELLLEQANLHLRRLHPRYSLARIDGTDLDILVIDHDMGDEPRTVQSLSGGEAFLTSLALALGLSSLSSRDVRVESLFIDEGFGTLDGRTLDTALSVLDGLQASGRQVGIISHVGGLAERIGVQVRVEPLGGGRSRVRIVEGRSGEGARPDASPP